jgi:hypothetical protein
MDTTPLEIPKWPADLPDLAGGMWRIVAKALPWVKAI